MTTAYLLDTSVMSHFVAARARERTPQVVERVERIASEQGLCISAVTLYEIRRGLRLLELRGEGQRKIATMTMLLQGATVVGLDSPGWRGWQTAAELYARAKAHQPAITLGEDDLLIAATAIVHSRVLLTTDLPLATHLEALGLAGHFEHCHLL